MKIGKRNPKKQPGRRVDELHRSPTRFELLRAWIERIPKVRLYIGLTVLTWLSLTALIGIGPRPLIERVISQGIIDPRDRTRLESLDLLQQSDPWLALLGVGIVDKARSRRFAHGTFHRARQALYRARLRSLSHAACRPLHHRNHAPRTEAHVLDGGDHQRQHRDP
jgi:hypothetical protein